MVCRDRLERLFVQEKVPYRVMQHSAAYTAQDVANAEHISGYDVAKVVMAVVDARLAMLVLPAPHRVDLELLRAGLRAQTARLAEEREFAEIFGDCEMGAMPPFGNLYGVEVCVDSALAAHGEITFNAGTHRETMTIAYADFVRLVDPRMLDLARSPRAA
jgi:Ala-tRNA(Pro) deacylase